MPFSDRPIGRKLRNVTLLVIGTVLLINRAVYFVYEYVNFRDTEMHNVATVGRIIASNSTAALAFDSKVDALENLSSLRSHPHILAAALYDHENNLFVTYPEGLTPTDFPAAPEPTGYKMSDKFITGFEAVTQNGITLGTLYLKSDATVIYERLWQYGLTTVMVIAVSFMVAVLLARRLHQQITNPILSLAQTARAISIRKDYSVRAKKFSGDETGELTDAFNQMLDRIEEQNKQIRSFNQELEQKVHERTKELEEANKELESFSYSVSHDLRAPLRSIHGYMKIFSESYMDQLDKEGRRLVENVLKNSKMMGQLIDDLLSFSRLSRKDLAKTNIPMESIVKTTWEEQMSQEPGRRVELRLNPLPGAFVDISAMRQVWTNLISNALKYSRGKETAIIEIGSTENEEEVVYYIKDNGAGFNMEYYDKLFGVFQRLHSPMEFEGTGVGLAIVHRIIAKHGGRVWGEGKLNEGATFYFSLRKDGDTSSVSAGSN